MRKKFTPAPSLAFKKLITLLLILFFSARAYCQTVSGTVSDANNQPVPGATVQVKHTNKATVTNESGRFQINASGRDVLIISSVNYVTQEIPLNNRSALTVSLAAGTQNLSEVVVTALGIKKQSRGLGYAATNVSTEDLTVNRTPNVINALEGKVAGVNISSMGTGPAGTSKIRIRGQSSLGGGNTPLIVINGVPVSRDNFNGGTVSTPGGGAFADGGDAFSSINPDDIESMTILKGAPAAALYGSRAKDGVIMITTKTKGKNKGIGLSYTGNYTDDTPLDFTDFQKVYGQGEGGVRPTTTIEESGAVRVMGKKVLQDEQQRFFNYLLTEGNYISGGPTNNGGAVFEWFAKQFGDFKRAFDLEDCIDNLITDATKVQVGSAGLIFLPYLQGERAPIWNANAKGVYFGLNIKHEQRHFIRATIEGIIYAIYSIGKTVEEHRTIKSLCVNGSFASFPFCTQMIADVFNKPVSINKDSDSVSVGAFLLSATEIGIYKNLDEAQ